MKPERSSRAWTESDGLTRDLEAYCAAACFRPRAERQGDTSGEGENPWWRPVGFPRGLDDADLAIPLAHGELGTRKARFVHRVLFNIYEQQLLFLPHDRAAPGSRADFEAFYDPSLVALGESMRPRLERIAFSFLEEHVRVTGPWTMEAFREYSGWRLEEHEAATPSVCERLDSLGSRNPEAARAALRWIVIQQAADALSEASGMSRYLGGSYGPPQSELAKVFVDEFGYGVHADKHSTLFERFAASVQVRPRPHAHFDTYGTAALLAANYFHFISCSKIHWPRYLGAIYWAEASLPHVNACMARTVAKLVPKADLTYFTEHVEIDRYHRRMVLDNVIAPVACTLGKEWLPGVLRGFEEFRVVGELVGLDWCSWIAALDGEKPGASAPATEDWPGAPGKPVEGGEPGVIDTPEALEGRPEVPA